MLFVPAGPRGGISGTGMVMVTMVMSFSVIAALVLLVFTKLFCACVHLRAAAAEHAQPSHADAFPTIHVEPSVATTFPTVKFGDDSQRPPAQESQCTVCLEEYEAKDVVRVLPYCGHAFHGACIDTWLKQHPTCPICRSTTKHRAAAGTMPPMYYAVAMAGQPFQARTSSSDPGALQQADPAAASATAAVGTDHMDVTSTRLEIDALQEDQAAPSATAVVGTDRMDVASTQLEIVISDEPASSVAPCPRATPAPSASEEYPCAETTRQSSQGNASEQCQC